MRFASRAATVLAVAVSMGWPLRALADESQWLPAPEGIDAAALAQQAEDTWRSDTTYMEATMTIESPRLPAPRVVRFRSWDDRPGGRAFIRILSPAKDAGTGFLKQKLNLWMYVPRVERTVRIPPSLMLQPWMGSDFTNDDLVRESSGPEDYQHAVLGIDPGTGEGEAYVLEYRPREDAPVVWDRIVAWLDREHLTPLRQDFYDEAGDVVRQMRFGEISLEQGRWFPHRWSMESLDRPGHATRIEIEEVRFDADADDSIYTTQRLQRALRP